GNRARSGGGGIRNHGAASISFSTITNNAANVFISSSAPGLGIPSSEQEDQRTGGGILNQGTLSIGNTIVAGNIDNIRSSGIGRFSPDCFSRQDIGLAGTLISKGGNLIGVVN